MAGSRRRRTWVISGITLLAIACILAPFVIERHTEYYSDGETLRTPGATSRRSIREVLWDKPVALDERINHPELDDYEPRISPHEDLLVFTRGRPGENAELWYAERERGSWSAARPLDDVNRDDSDELGAAFSADGRTLYFVSDREGGEGGYDIWRVERTDNGWSESTNLGESINSPWNELNPAPSPSGERLYLTSDRKRGEETRAPWRATIRARLEPRNYDIWVAERRAEIAPDGAALFAEARPFASVNTETWAEGAVAISPTRDFLYFASNRSGGAGGFDLYRTRITREGPRESESLGPLVNSTGNELDPCLSVDGFTLHFARQRDGQEDIFFTRSREVFILAEREGPYWSFAALLDFLRGVPLDLVVVLLYLMLALLLLYFFRRRLGTLTLLARCLLIALFVHLLMGVWANRERVERMILEMLDIEEPLDPFEVALESAPEEDLGLSIREAIAETASDEVPALATFTRTAPRTQRIESVPEPRALELEDVIARPRSVSAETDAFPRAAVDTTPIADDSPSGRLDAPALPEQQLDAPSTPELEVKRVETPREEKSTLAARARIESTPRQRRPLGTSLTRPNPPVETATSPGSETPAFDANASAAEARVTPIEGERSEALALPAEAIAPLDRSSPPAPHVDVASPRSREAPVVENDEDTRGPRLDSSRSRSSRRSRAERRPRALVGLLSPEPSAPAGTSMSDAASASAATARPLRGGVDTASTEDFSVRADLGPAPDALVAPAIASREQRATPDARSANLDADASTGLSSPKILRGEPSRRRPGTARARRGTSAGLSLSRARSTPRASPVPRAAELAGVIKPLGAATSDAVDIRTTVARQGDASSFVPRIYKLRGRAAREEALRRGGGSERTERAVEAGLAWLALHQSPDGRWSLGDYARHLDAAHPRDLEHRDWNGRGRFSSIGGSSKARNGDTAATGLALLAFLGHGDTQLADGPYRENVRRGLEWLVRAQGADGDLRGGGNLYMHGIAAFALCEAYAFTRAPSLREPAQKAIAYTAKSQNPQAGGWRYDPWPRGKDVDTSVFGWMLMAIKSARLGGLEVSDTCLSRATKYLRDARLRGKSGRWAYQPGNSRSSLAMTAQGLFSQTVLADTVMTAEERASAAHRRLMRDSIAYLSRNLPRPADMDGASFYYWYYGTLALFQAGGEAWASWNDALTKVLLENQVEASQGSARGSWDPRGKRALTGGRLYSTAMSILCLEVYYRYSRLEESRR